MDDAATFSPDGQQLAFVSTREGDDIFVMPFAPDDPGAGQRAVNLTRNPACSCGSGNRRRNAYSMARPL